MGQVDSVNGLVFPITRNLYNALQRLCHKDKVRRLWVDAICINQHNHFERSVQVQNMLIMHQKARRVLVWLGEHDNYSRAIIYCLALQTVEYSIENIQESSCVRHIKPFFSGLRDLLSRPWVSSC